METARIIRENDRPFWIAPLGDIQYNGDEEDIAGRSLREHIERAVDLGDVYFLGMGDYIDMASPTSRQKIQGSGAYDNTMKAIEDRAKDLTQEVFDKFLKPTKDRWIGLLSGHHFWPYRDGTNSDQDLCAKLGARYLGEGKAIIEFVIPTSRNNRTLRLYAMHGAGSGEESSLLLKLKKMAGDWEGIHAFMMGHMSKLATAPIPKLEAVFATKRDGTGYTARIVERRVPLIGTGAWSLAYPMGRTTYVERSATMRPVSLGAPLVEVIPTFQRERSASDGDVARWLPRLRVILE